MDLQQQHLVVMLWNSMPHKELKLKEKGKVEEDGDVIGNEVFLKLLK